jgi:hypothetical protein
MLSTLGQVVAAPQNAVSRVGQIVERGVEKSLGAEATTLAGKLAQNVVKKSVAAAAEGAVYGANEGANQVALSEDQELQGTQFAWSVGSGALFGAALGGSLGAAKTGYEGLSPGMRTLAGKLGARSFLTGRMHGAIDEFDRIPGGVDAAAQRAIDDGVIAAGDNVVKIADKAAEKYGELGEQIGAFRDAHGEQVPAEKVMDIFSAELKRLRNAPITDDGLIAKVEDLQNKFSAKYGVDLEQVAKEIPPVDIDALRAEVSEAYEKQHGPVDEDIIRRKARGEKTRPLSEGLPDYSDDAFDKTSAAVAEKAGAAEAGRATPEEKTGVVGKNALRDVQAADRAEAFEADVKKKLDRAKLEHARMVTAAQDKAITDALEARQKLVDVAAKEGIVGKTGGVSFKDLAEYRQALDQEKGIKWSKRLFEGFDDAKSKAYKNIRNKIEGVLEEHLDNTPKGLEKADRAQYQDLKLHYRQIKAITKYANRGAAAAQTNNIIGLGAQITGVAAAHLAAGPAAAALALAAAAGHHVLKTRGASTAAVIADKIAVLTAVQKATSKVEKQIVAGVEAIMGNKKSRVVTKEHGFPTFKDKAEAVEAAEKNSERHLEGIQEVSAHLNSHAPGVAAAFQSTAIQATTYLSSVLPRSKPVNPMQPNGPQMEPTKHDQFVFSRQFDAVHFPPAVLQHVAEGTVIPQEIAAIKAVSPKGLEHMNKLLLKDMEKRTAPLSSATARGVSLMTNLPANPTYQQINTAALQGNWAQGVKDGKQNTPGPSGKTPSGGGKSRATPKAEHMSFASSASLGPQSSRR